MHSRNGAKGAMWLCDGCEGAMGVLANTDALLATCNALLAVCLLPLMPRDHQWRFSSESKKNRPSNAKGWV